MKPIKIDNVKTELETLIAGSELTDAQKETWYNLIHVITESNAMLILETIREDADAINFLSENLEKKLKAVKTKSKEDWKNIIEGEVAFMKSKS